MMRVAFVLPELSHNAAIATSDITGFVDEEDDFRLVGAQSCVRRSSSTWMYMLPLPRRCPAVRSIPL
jgi:hypothetical protein